MFCDRMDVEISQRPPSWSFLRHCECFFWEFFLTEGSSFESVSFLAPIRSNILGFSGTVEENTLTLWSLFAIFEPYIWRRLGPVPACLVFLLWLNIELCFHGANNLSFLWIIVFRWTLLGLRYFTTTRSNIFAISWDVKFRTKSFSFWIQNGAVKRVELKRACPKVVPTASSWRVISNALDVWLDMSQWTLETQVLAEVRYLKSLSKY